MNQIEIKYVEEFIKSNPQFYLYTQMNKNVDCTFGHISTDKVTNWEALDKPCLVNIERETITISDLMQDGVQIYRIVKD